MQLCNCMEKMALESLGLRRPCSLRSASATSVHSNRKRVKRVCVLCLCIGLHKVKLLSCIYKLGYRPKLTASVGKETFLGQLHEAGISIYRVSQ